jgi:hypothetical protein
LICLICNLFRHDALHSKGLLSFILLPAYLWLRSVDFIPGLAVCPGGQDVEPVAILEERVAEKGVGREYLVRWPVDEEGERAPDSWVSGAPAHPLPRFPLHQLDPLVLFYFVNLLAFSAILLCPIIFLYFVTARLRLLVRVHVQSRFRAHSQTLVYKWYSSYISICMNKCFCKQKILFRLSALSFDCIYCNKSSHTLTLVTKGLDDCLPGRV